MKNAPVTLGERPENGWWKGSVSWRPPEGAVDQMKQGCRGSGRQAKYPLIRGLLSGECV